MELIAKLEHLTSRPNARQLRCQVYVMDRVRTTTNSSIYAVDGLHTAINDDRQVTFRYFDWRPDGGKEYRRDGALYRVDPVASAWTDITISCPTTPPSRTTAITGWTAWRASPSPIRPGTRCRRTLTWAVTSRPF